MNKCPDVSGFSVRIKTGCCPDKSGLCTVESLLICSIKRGFICVFITSSWIMPRKLILEKFLNALEKVLSVGIASSIS
ncbi:MAG: hypothetical protein A2015_06195 [Spirochaetes bacterium GWF1_31_7]|nr:MAG: hypothetical protein A2Y30_04830 [Spirochaetes bacterium GWE1_32_154]OHD46646.1 MAG: hypothetical protein A2015_06195 [Spirochaetes bacterium GWF1_31_7]OHD52610.1 MAG: hypothetical protein A2Y29_04765 [Spirochaetes bacterium GWE2_31_10]OHD81373.1 MAG: hypothetical protein A2355_17580 [Spirochaetes bacterium RIFOXYB1_FULL_32_8]